MKKINSNNRLSLSKETIKGLTVRTELQTGKVIDPGSNYCPTSPLGLCRPCPTATLQ